MGPAGPAGPAVSVGKVFMFKKNFYVKCVFTGNDNVLDATFNMKTCIKKIYQDDNIIRLHSLENFSRVFLSLRLILKRYQ